MKNNRHLTIGLLTGFIVGGCMGVFAKSFCHSYLCKYRNVDWNCYRYSD